MQDIPELDHRRVRQVFFPFVDERSTFVEQSRRRFAYYTSADTAFKVVLSREIWMRSTSTMNDYLETQHGFDCLNRAYISAAGARFNAALEAIFPVISGEILSLFNDWLPKIRTDSYIACLSEHLDEEDDHGRLSMWRAYGRRAGVALIINPDVMFLENPKLGIVASPVAYWTDQQVEAELDRVADRIRENEDFVFSLGRDWTKATIFALFRFLVLCTKHPGFEEEREWRIIASPQMMPSPITKQSIEAIGGHPQIVQKIQLRDIPEIGIAGIDLSTILSRIIVGPCEYPFAVAAALTELTARVFESSPRPTIQVSQIPLRTAAQ